MSDDPRDGVCNKWGQTHNLKSSFLVEAEHLALDGTSIPRLTCVDEPAHPVRA